MRLVSTSPRSRVALVSAVLAVLMACGGGGRRYEGTGLVEEVLADEGQVVIAHDDIPGLMDAMTMSFDAGPELLEGIAAGQRVEFALTVSQAGMDLVELRAVGEGDGASATGGASRFAAALARGERAPGFSLIDQEGRTLSLGDLAGRTLLVDFIFTECPGPCPILTAKHVAVQRSLADDVADDCWFVSISLDPATDTPERLTRYAEERGADLARWSFLTGDPQGVEAVVAAWGIGTTRNDDGEIDHLVASFLVDAQGRIAKRYLGLEYASEEIAADLRDLSRATAES